MTRYRFVALAVVCFLLGCGKKAPPPEVERITADTFYSRVGKSSVIALKWPAGHAVLVWTDIDGFCGGGVGPAPDGVAYSWSHREQVTRRKPAHPEFPPGAPRPPQPPQPPGPPPTITTTEETGRGVSWKCETPNGLSGRMTINGQSFDLSKGNVFLVTTTLGGHVAQVPRDLSGLKANHESIAELAKNDEAVGKFVTAAVPTP